MTRPYGSLPGIFQTVDKGFYRARGVYGTTPDAAEILTAENFWSPQFCQRVKTCRREIQEGMEESSLLRKHGSIVLKTAKTETKRYNWSKEEEDRLPWEY